MASGTDTFNLSTNMPENLSHCDTEDDKPADPSDPIFMEWGFTLKQLFRLALKFYREKDGKAMHIGYQDKLKLVALHRQAAHGKYRVDSNAASVGLLDVVGTDRRQAWQALGDMSKETASHEFVKLLDRLCPMLRPYVEAHRTEAVEKERKRREEEETRKRLVAEEEQRRREEESRQSLEAELQRHQQQELLVRAALNQQTEQQFRLYAEAQVPGDREQQALLIKQLQEQHFQQYMQQVYQQQLLAQQQQQQLPSSYNFPSAQPTQACCDGGSHSSKEALDCHHGDHLHNSNGCTSEAHQNGHASGANGAAIPEGSMWTRKDINEFKDAIKKEAKLQKHADSIIKVGSGETVTIRVPTHDSGNCLFWEFATDYYDIAFGVYFEWNAAPQENVQVHVSDSSEDENDEEGQTQAGNNPTSSAGPESTVESKKSGPPLDEVVPIYRRSCNDEVYCGSHVYPGKGVYLLKFDNSYSLWRSKTLYYRVYYS